MTRVVPDGSDDAARRRLADEFRHLPAATIADAVSRARTRLTNSRVSDFVAALLHRYAREILRATTTPPAGRRPEVLFVCVQNAGRSQMAAALLRHLAGDRIVVRSAGSAPATEIHAGVVEALAEIGLDAGDEFPKPLADEFVRAADAVVTMGCGDTCPVFPGKRYEDWRVADPSGRPVEEVRAIREDIRGRVKALCATLGVPIREEG